MINLSISKHQAYDFKAIAQPFDKLSQITGCDWLCYSVGKFKAGHRTQLNWEGSNNCIVLDIDGGVSLDGVKSLIDNRHLKALIVTTRNHQKEKNEIVADRFRVLLPTSDVFEGNAREYTQYMREVNRYFFNISDPATEEVARMYYCNPLQEEWYSEGTNLLSYAQFKPIPKPVKEFKPLNDEDKSKMVDLMVHKYTDHIKPGERNKSLRTLFFVLIDKVKIEPSIARDVIISINSGLRSDWQLDEDEIDLITREAG